MDLELFCLKVFVYLKFLLQNQLHHVPQMIILRVLKDLKQHSPLLLLLCLDPLRARRAAAAARQMGKDGAMGVGTVAGATPHARITPDQRAKLHAC